MLEVRFFPVHHIENERFLYAVVGAKNGDKWVFCKHKSRDTLELPGGHREPGELISDTAKRELFEETGAETFTIRPVCDYSVKAGEEESFGMLFYAEVQHFGPLPDYEMEKIELLERFPEKWTYPLIQPKLLERIKRDRSAVRAVLFDMDGLMFDTEKIYVRAWAQAGKAFGFDIPESMVAQMLGLDNNTERKLFEKAYGPGFDFDAVFAKRSALVSEIIAGNGVPVMPGLYGLLDSLDEKQIKKAVVTSTRRRTCEPWLESTGVLGRFDAVVTGDMVKKSKPEPEIFLIAARSLGVPPQNCMVLEDSPNGILAAHRAGMKPVMIPDLKQPDEQTMALLYAKLDSLGDVVKYGLV